MKEKAEDINAVQCREEEGSNSEVRTGPKPNTFHYKVMRSLGNRKDRAKNAHKLLNHIFFDLLSIKDAAIATGISEETARKILKHESTKLELKRLGNAIRVNALARVNRSIGSNDERNAILAADRAWKMVESLEERESTSTAPVIDMTALVSSVASNLLAGAMLGVSRTLQDNSSYPASLPDGNQVLSTKMGSTSTSSAASSSDDEYIDPEVLHVPEDE